ncbi:diguanylate cyclase [Candidatus Ferrigenium straubiae]|jgi:diguanylate cyclase|uniref:diguanylate cyclase n=1 Tax=Candidatus Ferrigenium straubiae TaxID=2919506 RepID=UPI003F4AD96C
MIKLKQSREFAADWQRLSEETPVALRRLVGEIVRQQAAGLADLFYRNMLDDEEARTFLDNDLVNQRLHASMQRWLCELFSDEQQYPEAIYKHQCHIGEVHARIQVPIALVMRGARMLKHAIHGHLVESTLGRGELVKASNFVAETIELALDAMTDYYVIDMEKQTRTDEAYRMFALGQNMLAERERQRAAILEWAQQILLKLLAEGSAAELPDIKHSEFGMWLQHKAAIIFESAPELEQIRRRIEDVEKSLFPKLIESRKNPGDGGALMKEIEAGIAEIKFMLGGLFDRFIEVESGRDALTRLLNRRFLPAVLTREMALARRSSVPFAVLLLDLDRFKKINDTYGHAAGDLVLQQAADLVTGSVRAGDFVFRYGGEEMLVVLVEVGREQALQVAESIRQKFAAEPLRVGDGQTTQVTTSVGIATYNGHPDYETMLKDADGALYEAKEAGRNRCVVSGR